MSLTDHQLEVAARELCRLRGLDPDREVDVGGKWLAEYRLAWVVALRDLSDDVQAALAAGQRAEREEKK